MRIKYSRLSLTPFLWSFVMGTFSINAFSKPTSDSTFIRIQYPAQKISNEAFNIVNFAGTFNVKTFGAKGDGKTIDSRAINRAIEAAYDSGGGTVYFPAGTYLSGSIHLKSHITLYLGQGCIIEASDDPNDYNKPEPNSFDQYQDFGHSHWQNSLIWGINIEDIAIEGPGCIYGRGLAKGTPRAETEGLGDKTIALKNCHNVTLRGFSILQGGHFGILATGVDNLTIDNLLIDTNRDGMDIDCCKNVRISNCSVNSPWDDAICLKSSYALGKAIPTEDVTITNCFVTGGYQEGTLLDGTFKPIGEATGKPTGRIKLGTESNGGFKNITISNCVFDHCRGLALETVDGGNLEDISISNITMRDILNAPVFIRLGSRMRGPKGVPVGHLRRINMDNIVVYGTGSETGCIMSGIPGHPIEGISISNFRTVFKGGGKEDAIHPPEDEDGYPEPDMFGETPAYGFYIRHARGLTLYNIQLSYKQKEERPPFVLNDVDAVHFRFIQAEHDKNIPLMKLDDSEDINLFQVDHYAEKKITKVVKETLR